MNLYTNSKERNEYIKYATKIKRINGRRKVFTSGSAGEKRNRIEKHNKIFNSLTSKNQTEGIKIQETNNIINTTHT